MKPIGHKAPFEIEEFQLLLKGLVKWDKSQYCNSDQAEEGLLGLPFDLSQLLRTCSPVDYQGH